MRAVGRSSTVQYDSIQYIYICMILKRHCPHSQNCVGAASAKASLFAADIESFTLLIVAGPHL